MKRLTLTGACLLCLAQPLAAQAPEPLPGQGPIAETAAAIVRERWPIDPVTFRVDDERRPMFRAEVTATLLPPPWRVDPDDVSPVPARGAISHQEMLAVMTPQAFSSPVISPPGAGVDPGAIWQGIRRAWRERQARRIHERVTREVAALRAATMGGDDGRDEAAPDGP